MRVTRPRQSRGFGLFEMIVNLGLMASTLGMIAALVAWASATVSGTTGRIAASEKAEAIRRLIASDLSAVADTGGGAQLVTCQSGPEAWSLSLRLPSNHGGWKETEYRWSRGEGTLRRVTEENGRRLERVIGTGFSAIESRWMGKPSENPKECPQTWTANRVPALLHLEVRTTLFREEGSRDKPREVHAGSESFGFMMPVGGGPAAF